MQVRGSTQEHGVQCHLPTCWRPFSHPTAPRDSGLVKHGALRQPSAMRGNTHDAGHCRQATLKTVTSDLRSFRSLGVVTRDSGWIPVRGTYGSPHANLKWLQYRNVRRGPERPAHPSYRSLSNKQHVTMHVATHCTIAAAVKLTPPTVRRQSWSAHCAITTLPSHVVIVHRLPPLLYSVCRVPPPQLCVHERHVRAR
jgi:hypothetical protein